MTVIKKESSYELQTSQAKWTITIETGKIISLVRTHEKTGVSCIFASETLDDVRDIYQAVGEAIKLAESEETEDL